MAPKLLGSWNLLYILTLSNAYKNVDEMTNCGHLGLHCFVKAFSVQELTVIKYVYLVLHHFKKVSFAISP